MVFICFKWIIDLEVDFMFDVVYMFLLWYDGNSKIFEGFYKFFIYFEFNLFENGFELLFVFC